MNMALIHRERGELEQALHWMTLAIAMDPSLAVAYEISPPNHGLLLIVHTDTLNEDSVTFRWA